MKREPLPATDEDRFLVLSAHDYRTPRRANIHFIAEQLARCGKTRFFSLRYSRLSRLTGDPRLPIDECANRIEHVGGVDCFLWKPPIHPFNTRLALLRPAETLMYRAYVAAVDPLLRVWIEEATVILFESGVAPVFFDMVKRLNPAARTIYIASDDLDTIGVAAYVKRCFARAAPAFDTIRLPSRTMADSIPSSANLRFVPHGIDPALVRQGGYSPYGEGIHAVAVGSMLFDADFFTVAARRFPHITFHVIGCGRPRHPDWGQNVRLHEEMPHAETVRYIRHARFGIAPYRAAQVPAYLADTSMKLIQYDFFGLPAVCPRAVVGDYASRFGYTPDDDASIARAIGAALDAPRRPSRRHLDWAEVTARILAPDRFEDTRVGPPRTADDDSETLWLGGFPVESTSGRALSRRILDALDRDRQLCLFFANANFVVQCAALRSRLIDQGTLITNDGIGMDLAARMIHGAPFRENLNGTDFVPRLLALARCPVYLLGGEPGIAARAGETLQTRFGLTVAGARDGFAGLRNRRLVHEINASGAEIVLVALGNPRQEAWILQHRRLLHARLLIGVGALLDFLAGDKQRAPQLVRSCRLEWAWRLALEPRRLLRRYTVDIARFAARCRAHRGAGWHPSLHS